MKLALERNQVNCLHWIAISAEKDLDNGLQFFYKVYVSRVLEDHHLGLRVFCQACTSHQAHDCTDLLVIALDIFRAKE
jgi:hypothetical protein